MAVAKSSKSSKNSKSTKAVKKTEPKQVAKAKPENKSKVSKTKTDSKEIATDYKIGDYVVYPHHGTAKIVKIFKRKLKNKTWTYLKLQVVNSDLELEIPAENTKKLKVRKLLTKQEIKKVLDIIGSKPDKSNLTWSKRYKLSIVKLLTANVYKIAEIVRDLHHRSMINDISSEERKMLAKTRKILASEFIVVLGVNEQEAHDLLNKALKFKPSEDDRENSIYGPVSNSSTFDSAGLVGIHRIKNKKKVFKMFDKDEGLSMYDMLDSDNLDELPDEEEILDDDSFDDVDDV